MVDLAKEPEPELGSAAATTHSNDEHPAMYIANGDSSPGQALLGLGHPLPSSSVRASSASHLPLASSSTTPTASAGAASVPFPLSASSSHLPPSTQQNNGYLSAPSQSMQHPRNSLSSSTSSSNPDALHVQRTYQRIAEVGGIPGDGFVTGVELTRERRTEASISGYLSPLMASTSSSRSKPPFTRQESGPAFGNLLSVNSNAYSFSKPQESGQESTFDHASGASLRKPSLVPSARSVEDEAEELKLLEKVDRYGFFAPTYAQHARLVLLSQKSCLDLPPENLLKASTSSRRKSSAAGGASANGTRTKRRSLTGNPSALESPYIQLPETHSNGASQESSRRSSLQPNGGSSSRLPSSSNGSPSSPSRRTFSQSAAGAAAIPDNVSSSTSYSAKENSRTDKWYNEMLLPDGRDSGGNIVSWRLASEKDDKTVLRRVCKGVPDRWRAAAWQAMINRKRKAKGRSANAEDAQLNRRFFDAILEPCEHDVQIDLDVPRTISGHLYFHTRYGLGQRSLFNVLHAFALHCPECGYCQGMGSLAATFLCYLPPERAYAAMIHLHDTYNLHTIFAPGFPGMLECFHVQEKLVELLMPEVTEVFDKNHITISSFATKWYITLFANAISFSTQLRIWDAFLLEGKVVLILVSTAIIWVLRHHFTSPQADFESILTMLSSFFVPEEEDSFMRLVRKMLKRPDLRAKMREWEAEYRASQAPPV